jgi:hypothetical protein
MSQEQTRLAAILIGRHLLMADHLFTLMSWLLVLMKGIH